MATADEEAMEGHRGGLEMGATEGPVGTISVGGEGHGRGSRVSAHHEGGVQGFRESAPRGQGGGGERRGGGSRPALDCALSLVFSSRRFFRRRDFFFPLSFLCLSLLLVVWETHYDRLGRSGCKGLR